MVGWHAKELSHAHAHTHTRVLVIAHTHTPHHTRTHIHTRVCSHDMGRGGVGTHCVVLQSMLAHAVRAARAARAHNGVQACASSQICRRTGAIAQAQGSLRIRLPETPDIWASEAGGVGAPTALANCTTASASGAVSTPGHP